MNVYLGQHWSVNDEHAVIAKYGKYKITTGSWVWFMSVFRTREQCSLQSGHKSKINDNIIGS